MRASAEAGLRDLAARVPEHVEVSTLAKANPAPVRALHEAVEELGASVLVTGSSHRGEIGRVVPGGVGERLLHAAPCPVAIAPHAYHRPPAGVKDVGVAYVDGPDGVNALRVAGRLAKAAGARVTTYTVIGDTPVDVERILRKARQELGDVDLQDAVVLRGDPAAELAAVSATLDLLVTGSRGYGPVLSLIVGSVSQELAHRVFCPLLVVGRVPEG
jgi:nucleotide-binding universal stress UspA family protein